MKSKPLPLAARADRRLDRGVDRRRLCRKAPPAPVQPAGPPPAPTLEQLQSASVSGVFEQAVTLSGGVYEGEPAAADASSRPRLALWAPTLHFGDIDGAEGNEAVAVLSSTSGGSGEFVHVAVFGVRDGALVNLGRHQSVTARSCRACRSARQLLVDSSRPGPTMPPAARPRSLARPTRWTAER